MSVDTVPVSSAWLAVSGPRAAWSEEPLSADEVASAGADRAVFSASGPEDAAAVRRLGALTAGMEGRPRRAEEARAARPPPDTSLLRFSRFPSADVAATSAAPASSELRSDEKKTSTGRPPRPEAALPPATPSAAFSAFPAPPAVEVGFVEVVFVEVVFEPDDDALLVDFGACLPPAEDPDKGVFARDADFSVLLPAEDEATFFPAVPVSFFSAGDDVSAEPVDRADDEVFLPVSRPLDVEDAVDAEGVFSGDASEPDSAAAAAADVARRPEVVVLFAGAGADSEDAADSVVGDGDAAVSSVSVVLWIRAPRPRPRPPRRVFFTRPPEANSVPLSLDASRTVVPRNGRLFHVKRR